ncbi:hypothetical protein CVT26_011850 [Gymnopilus dilepis]|uniref:Major facilitator superfamily (MFS) profile domain-containing protein n=1 Tax=Gymnopilus dilepis TaxID=231916 RepID=A0A409WK33_9AGAR|nr:hypothetical protein CVT26_011850 [Gymnopilus dilepis]
MATDSSRQSHSSDTVDEKQDVSTTTDHSKSNNNAPEDGQRSRRGWRFWLIFLALCMCNVVAALDMGSMGTALPVIIHDLGGSQSFVWVSSAYTLATVAVIPLSGRLAEIFGRRHALLGSLVVFSAGSLICALSPDMVVLIVGRAVQGVGSGLIQTLATIVLGDIVTLKERGFYSSITGIAFTVATGAGPFIGGAIVEKTTWRWLFYITLPPCGLAFAFVFLFLQVKTPPRKPLKTYLIEMDLIGNSLIIASTTASIFALTWGGVRYAWTSVHVLAPLIIGIAGLMVSLVYEFFFASHPSIPFKILSNPTSLSGPIYFQAAKAASPLLSGLYVFPMIIMISPSAIIQGLLVSKIGHYRLIARWALMLLGVGLLSHLNENTPVGISVPFQMIASAGFGLLFATTFSVLAPLEVMLNAPALAFLTFMRTFPKSWGVTIGATIIQNVLKRHLPEEFISNFTSASDLTYVAIPTIPKLGEPLKAEVRAAYSFSLRILWLTQLGLCAVGFLSVFGQKEIPLHNKKDSKWGIKEKDGDTEQAEDTNVDRKSNS